jgi:hypothetical protein
VVWPPRPDRRGGAFDLNEVLQDDVTLQADALRLNAIRTSLSSARGSVSCLQTWGYVCDLFRDDLHLPCCAVETWLIAIHRFDSGYLGF